MKTRSDAKLWIHSMKFSGKGKITMKISKRILAMVLTIAMVMGLATTAFAAMEGELTDGVITIKNAEPNQTYSAYQILYLESYDATNNKYAYKANSQWEAWLRTQTDYVEFNDGGYVTWVDAGTPETNAQKAAAFAALAKTQLAGKTPDKTAAAGAGATEVTLSGLKLGYYLVDTTLGTLCSLDTTNPNVEMEEKNEAPTLEKFVQENRDGSWAESNDVAFNQNMTFETHITVKKGAENYVLHDKMSHGLTFKNYVGVYYYEPVVNPTTGEVTYPGNRITVNRSNYEVVTPGSCNEKCTFEVKISNEFISSLAIDTKIVVEYTAYLNDDAVVGNIGNPNDAWLQYGDENHPSYTPKDTTITYTGSLGIYKYTMNGEKKVLLPGAEFELKRGNSNYPIRFHNTTVNPESDYCTYEVCHTDNKCTKEHTTTLISSAVGSTYNIKILGLDAGTYQLIETKAPAGYNKLSEPKVIDFPNKNNNNTFNYNIVIVEVENNAGVELPSTGGMGTTMFYVLGSCMALAAVVLLVTKRRMSIAE